MNRMMDHSDKGQHIIVAVDGPAGSGKSSVCAKISQTLGWNYVNTGILYRAIAWLAVENDIEFDDHQKLLELVDDSSGKLSWNADSQSLCFSNNDITAELFSDEVGQMASAIAKQPSIRSALLPLQRQLAFASQKPAIIDGRDIGTVVFPDADLKIFLTASIEERAKRRLAQFDDEADKDQAFEELKKSIHQRDQQDEKRGVAPLKQADDAVRMDTSSMSLQAVVTNIIELIKDKKLL